MAITCSRWEKLIEKAERRVIRRRLWSLGRGWWSAWFTRPRS